MIIGMGAAAIVVEVAEAAEERGIRPIAEVLAGVTANSAFHGTRLDVHHITGEMERLLTEAEQRWGLDRHELAPQTVFVSHETYTPARGGSASAEIASLRSVFGSAADGIVIANTKGLTGHAMGTGIEDVVAVKSLETGLVPPIPNFKETDPELGELNLSRGGAYPVQYALRLAAGFGSQISMILLRWVPALDGRRHAPDTLGYEYRIEDPQRWRQWLARVSGLADADVDVVQHQLRVVEATTVEEAPAAVEAATVEEAPTAVEATTVEEAPAAVEATTVEEAPTAVEAATVEEAPTAVEAAAVEEAPTGVEAAAVEEAPATVEAATVEATPVEEAPAAVAEGEVRERVLALVAEKTGYPQDMLDLDLDLEADLGVDTVKQAELFATVREAYGIERDDNVKLRDFPTLAHVIRFVMERAGGVPTAPIEAAAVEAATVESTAPVEAAAAVAEGEVRERVLALVAEKTGYPQDMLELDLELEADLGVDTVKQAELFATVREAYGIERDDNVKLRDFPTLAHVIRFVMERAGGLPTAPIEAAAVEAATVEGTDVTAGLESCDMVTRRVPVPILRPPLNLCCPTGVQLHAGARVVVMPDRGGAGDSLIRLLADRGVEVLVVDGTSTAESLAAQLSAWAGAGGVQGVYWLPALDSEPPLAQLDIASWKEHLRIRVKLLATAMRSLYEQVASSGTFLVVGTRMGGHHGYDDGGATAPMGGAVTGFAKTYKRERPNCLVKAVDLATTAGAGAIAAALIEETERDPGAVEIGRQNDLRWTIGLQEQAVEDGRH